MNKNKLLYEQPGCKILVVRFEGRILEGSPYGQDDLAGGDRKRRIIDDEY